jgi:hypothetical protein
MRPSRIVVGEVRQEESLDLLIALNSGLPGMCTIHANSAREAVTKMCTLPLLAGENVGHATLGLGHTSRWMGVTALCGISSIPFVGSIRPGAVHRKGSIRPNRFGRADNAAVYLPR